jgi:hypothetical protein
MTPHLTCPSGHHALSLLEISRSRLQSSPVRFTGWLFSQYGKQMLILIVWFRPVSLRGWHEISWRIVSKYGFSPSKESQFYTLMIRFFISKYKKKKHDWVIVTLSLEMNHICATNMNPSLRATRVFTRSLTTSSWSWRDQCTLSWIEWGSERETIPTN